MRIKTVNKHLPGHIWARREGKRIRIESKESNLSYTADPKSFGSESEMAAFMASKIPRRQS